MSPELLEDYQTRKDLERSASEAIDLLLQFAQWEWNVAEAAIIRLEDKASSLVNFCGVSAAVILFLGTRDAIPAWAVAISIVAHVIAMAISSFCRIPAFRPHIPSPLETLVNIARDPSYPVKSLFIRRLGEAVISIRNLQRRKAALVDIATAVWLTGLAPILLSSLRLLFQ